MDANHWIVEEEGLDAKDQPLAQQGYDLMGAAFAVRNELNWGFTEEVYQEALELEMRGRSIAFQAQPEVRIYYKGRELRKKFRPDLLVGEAIIVELKAVSALTPECDAQLLNYLKASCLSVGYLINFGARSRLEWKRFVRTSN